MFNIIQNDVKTVQKFLNKFQCIKEYPTNRLDGNSILCLVIDIVGLILVWKIIKIAMQPSVTIHRERLILLIFGIAA